MRACARVCVCVCVWRRAGANHSPTAPRKPLRPTVVLTVPRSRSSKLGRRARWGRAAAVATICGTGGGKRKPRSKPIPNTTSSKVSLPVSTQQSAAVSALASEGSEEGEDPFPSAGAQGGCHAPPATPGDDSDLIVVRYMRRYMKRCIVLSCVCHQNV
jgi:hypothetical protein